MQTAFIKNLCLGGAVVLLAAGCTSGSAVVKGDGIDKAQLDDFKCSAETLKGKSSPFLVSWPDAAREDIELAMNDGIVVVKYTCDGVQILDACEVLGEYSYQGMEIRKKIRKMNDSGEAAASFGGSFAIPGNVSASMSQGRTLNLAYSIVGARSTTVKRVTRDMLKGDEECAGATHFVYRTKVGAFAMDTSEAGKASMAAAAWGYGEASGSTSSSDSELTQGGDIKSCNDSSASDTALVKGCGAPLRVSLWPIRAAVEGETSAEPEIADEKGCPEGFVYANDGCARPAADVVPLCGWDVAECKTNCEKGSVDSCGRLSEVLLGKYWHESVGALYNKDIATVQTATAGLAAKIKSACEDGGEGAACTLFGFLRGFEGLPIKDPEAFGGQPGLENKEPVADFAKYMEMGCNYDNSIGCVNTVFIYFHGIYSWEEKWGELTIPKDKEKGLRLIQAACNRGSAKSCSFAAAMAENFSQAPNKMQLVHSNLVKACAGGEAAACFIGGIFALEESVCTELLTSKEVSERITKDELLKFSYHFNPSYKDKAAIAVGTAKIKDEVCAKTKAHPEAARLLLKQACRLDSSSAVVCETSKAHGK